MRVIQNALGLARIAGLCAGIRHARRAARIGFAAALDELSALLLLWRARLLKQK